MTGSNFAFNGIYIQVFKSCTLSTCITLNERCPRESVVSGF